MDVVTMAARAGWDIYPIGKKSCPEDIPYAMELGLVLVNRAGKGERPLKITNALTAGDKPNPHGVSAKPIYDSPHAAAVHITLQPGQSLKKHATPVDVFFYVLEGSGIVEIGEEKEKVSRDMIIESPARIPHRLENDGDQLFRVLVVKVPKPVEPTRFL